MVKLSATLSLVDGFTSKLNKINNELAQSGQQMSRFKRMISAIDTSGLDRATKSSNGLFKSMLGANLVTQGISALGRGAQGLLGDLSSASATWQTFQGNMEMVGKTPAEIASTKKELQDFATKTIYSASEMASTYSQLEAVGIKSADKLTMGFGGLAAAAANPQQAMTTLSQQATQMAAKPMVQWQDFKLMLEQTPAGISQIAKTMGRSTAQLVKDVQNGTIKTQDFFDAITTTGTNAKFTEMATQFKTVGQAMDGFKEGLTNKLQPTFDKMSQYGIKAFDNLSKFVDKINFDKIGDNLIKFIDSAINSVKQLWAGFKDSGAITAVSSAFSAIGSAADKLSASLPKGETLFNVFGASLGNLIKFAAGAIEDVANAISRMSPGQVEAMVSALKNAAIAMVGFKVASAAFKKGLAVYQGVSGAVTSIKALAKVMKLLPAKSKASAAAPALPPAPKVGNAAANWIGAAKVAGVMLAAAISIKLVASAFAEIAKVNVSWGQLGQNLAQMGVFLLASAVAMGVIGGAIKLFPPIAAALAIGAAVFIGIAGTMALVGQGLASFAKSSAEAIKTLNGVKFDKNFADKLLGILGAMTGLAGVGMFTGVLGTLAAPFAILGGIGFAAIALTISKMAAFAQRLTRMKLPETGTFNARLRQVEEIAKTLATVKFGKLGNVGTIFSSAFAGLTTGNVIATFQKVANFVQTVAVMPPIDSSILQSRFEMLAGIKNQLELAAQGVSGSGVDFSTVMTSWFGSLDTDNIVKSFSKVANLVKEISTMEMIDSSGLDSRFETIKGVFNKIREFASEKFDNAFLESLKSFFGKMDTSNLVSSFTKVTDLTTKIAELPKVSEKTIDAKFKSIKHVFEKLKDFKIEAYKGDTSNLDTYKGITDSIEKITKFITGIAEANIVDISQKLTDINNSLGSLSTFEITVPKNAKTLSTDLDTIQKIVDPISKIATALGTIASTTDLSGIGTKITEIQGAVNSVAGFKIDKKETDLSALSTIVDKLKPIVDKITSIGQSLQTLSGVVVMRETIEATLNAIKTLLNNGEVWNMSGGLEKVSGLQKGFDSTSTAINSLAKMVNTINAIPTIAETADGNVKNIKTVLDSLGTLTFDSDKATAVTTAVDSLVTSLNGMVTKFQTTGSDYAAKLGEGFSSGMASAQTNAVSAMDGLILAVNVAATAGVAPMKTIGAQIAQGLADGMRSALDSVTAAANELVAQAEIAAQAKAKIHSPSRLFRDNVGWWVGAGMAQGMDKSQVLVSNAGSGMVSTAYQAAQNAPGQPLRQSASTTNTTNNQTKQVNFNFGGITIQSSGSEEIDAEKILGKLEQLLLQKQNAGLAW